MRLAVRSQVNNIQSPVLFTLDDNYLVRGENLLVLLVATPKSAIKQSQTVGVMGVVRPFVVADIQKQYGITWDERVKRQLEADYTNKPILVADTMYP